MLTEEQITAAFATVMGFPPRDADVQAVIALGGTTETLTEYLWDHWLGEPAELSVEALRRALEDALD
jgi:hypothetical protein